MIQRCGTCLLVFLLITGISCSAQQFQPQPDFYEGLKSRRNNESAQAINHFTAALDSANPRVAAAAAAELMSMHFAGAEIPPDLMGKIRQNAAGVWAEVFDVQETASDNHESALAFLLGGGRNRFRDEAAMYAQQVWRDAPDNFIFSPAENAAIDGRIAVSRSRFNEALIFFRVALNASPALFLQFPDLLADLGLAFQYTASGNEGTNLFLEWERQITAPKSAIRGQSPTLAVISGNETLVRYLLLFYAGRITRQRSDSPDRMARSAELFARALPLAPEDQPDQIDACIWYIFDAALAVNSATAIRQLEQYAPQWRNEAAFFGLTDQLARQIILARQWDYLVNAFGIVRNHAVTAGRYAWVIGRALEEDLLSPEQIRHAEEVLYGGTPPANGTESLSRAYKRVAYNVGTRALYYRYVAALALGEPFLSLPHVSPAADTSSDTMRFLVGFFENDAAEFASRFIRAEENDLSANDLRYIALALGNAELHQESIRLVSVYTRRDGYELVQQDLQISHPQPFNELTDQHAADRDIDPAVLFALIRTESAFNPNAVSHAGAIGLTQLMPATAEETATRIRRQGGPDFTFGGIDDNTRSNFIASLRDPATNIHIGTTYLARLNELMVDPMLALLAYNAGQGRVRRWRSAEAAAALPIDIFLETVEFSETRNYGRAVTAAAAVYRMLYY